MEADGLRWSLLVIGSLVIVGLAVHGIWLSRKNSEKKSTPSKHKNDQEYQPSGWQSDTDRFDEDVNYESRDTDDDLDIKFDIEGDEIASAKVAPDIADATSTTNDFDDLGVGAVRVVSSAEKGNENKVSENTQQTPETNTQVEPEKTPSSKIYASVVTQPKPEYAAKHTSLSAETVTISQQERATSNHSHTSPKVVASQFSGASNHGSKDNYQAPEPPPFLLKKEVPEPEPVPESVWGSRDIAEQPTKADSPAATAQQQTEDKPHATLAEKLSLSEQARNLVKLKKADSVRKRREPKMTEDQMRIDFDDQPTAKPEQKEDLKTQPVESEQPQEVLVLNVKSADDNPIPGSALLPMLLTLGFKFGDQDIFHRHVNSNGKGPVLFSLANMFKPGNFDIDNLENFTTQGISLFMILPIEGEPHQVFNMMHNAARKIAEEFSAQIYDGKRTLLTKQSLQQYVEKIREFERQRLLRV
ncbi:cell division protein ZipA [Paraglaciecola sp. MB-3u-78]|jgi:cell division protein ZipA|uniref:cell division protein ZipA n=1 Tax=Paraglaciecola sp. MB-3u-78 TaxID=2058332 RepID=UPI000C33345E|nr:cell division protein ZipA [Paraglaciecola sp. MB-3u-78]PKG99726.1 cell division protein ZipA [Paraglaciecola sp. MB-3u-78]